MLNIFLDQIEENFLPQKKRKLTGIACWIRVFPENLDELIGAKEFLYSSFKISLLIYALTPIAVVIAVASHIQFSWRVAISVLLSVFVVAVLVVLLVNSLFTLLWNRRVKKNLSLKK